MAALAALCGCWHRSGRTVPAHASHCCGGCLPECLPWCMLCARVIDVRACRHPGPAAVMTLDFWRESAAELARAQPALPVRVIWGTRAMALCLNTLNAYWFSQARAASRLLFIDSFSSTERGGPRLCRPQPSPLARHQHPSNLPTLPTPTLTLPPLAPLIRLFRLPADGAHRHAWRQAQAEGGLSRRSRRVLPARSLTHRRAAPARCWRQAR